MLLSFTNFFCFDSRFSLKVPAIQQHGCDILSQLALYKPAPLENDPNAAKQCPGGDLDTCIDVCPGFNKVAFGLCVAECGERCPWLKIGFGFCIQIVITIVFAFIFTNAIKNGSIIWYNTVTVVLLCLCHVCSICVCVACVCLKKNVRHIEFKLVLSPSFLRFLSLWILHHYLYLF